MGTEREVSTRFVPSLTLFYFLFGFFQFSYLALAETDEVIIQLKRQDIERYLMYERDKKIAPQYAMKQATSQALPVDTDDDGMPDEWEVAQGLNPNDPDDAWFDPDGDEVVNLFEYQLGSDINDPTTPPVVTVAPVGAEFSDVSTAIEAVAPGTTLRVAGGSYAVNYTTFDPKVVMLQGGWDADFRQRDLQRSPTILDGGQLEEILYFSNNRGEPVIILDGLHFVRGSGSFGAVNLLARDNTFLRASMVNCTITESVAGSVFGSVLSLHHWDMSRSDRTIANTIIAGNVGSGIYSQNTNNSQARWRLIHTTISHNTNGGVNGYGIEAFTLDNGMLDAHIYNSIIWGNEQDDISIKGNIIFDVHHSDIGNVNATSGAVYEAGDGVLNVDPLFVDPLSNDFHLQASSPVLDQGIETGIPGIDFEGDPRIVETGADFGADEYPANSIPVANAGSDQTVRLSNQVDLDGSGSFDADGDTLSYDWSIAQAPAGSVSTLTELTMAQTSFTPDQVGTYVVSLIVNDGQDDSLPNQVSITVTDVPLMMFDGD